jgi:hypothetical protein
MTVLDADKVADRKLQRMNWLVGTIAAGSMLVVTICTVFYRYTPWGVVQHQELQDAQHRLEDSRLDRDSLAILTTGKNIKKILQLQQITVTLATTREGSPEHKEAERRFDRYRGLTLPDDEDEQPHHRGGLQ